MTYIIIAFALAGGTAFSIGAVIYNRMPANWLCDYGEEPSQKAMSHIRLRLRAAIPLTIASAVCCALCAYNFGGVSVDSVCALIICITLILTAVADSQFTIIPDQFLVFCCAAGIVKYIVSGIIHGGLKAWLFPLLSSALCAGSMLLLALIGKLVYRKDVLGMGDVKLMAVCGFVCGVDKALYVIIISILSAGLHFALLAIIKKLRAGEYKPLGPYISFATCCTLSVGFVLERAVGWYISLIS